MKASSPVYRGRFLTLVFTVALIVSTHAAVTNVAWYHLGEGDFGAMSGSPLIGQSQDSVGTKHLQPYNSPRYTNDVSSTAAFAVDSSLAIKFDGASQYLSNTVVTTAADNFGVEAWVRPNSVNPGSVYIVCNGNPNSGGWSIVRNGNQYQANWGTSSFGSGTATPGVWTHLALVRDNGVGTFYVNGVATGISAAFVNVPSADGFIVAGQYPPTAFFGGDIDEVRVFGFNFGQFSTNDLLLNVTNVRTLPATSVAINNASLNGSLYAKINPLGPPASGWFEWGISNYANATPPQNFGTGSIATNFSQTITGLSSGFMYQFRAVAQLGAGGMIFGTNRTFTTPGPPLAQTLSASVSNATVTLFGNANPVATNTFAWFQWGTTTNFGNTTPPQAVGSGTSNITFSQILNGVAGATYYFRAVASNSLGVVVGSNLTFTTPLFFEDTSVVLPGTYFGTVEWGDYDNDGRLDILLANAGTNGTAQIWRNTGTTFSNINAALFITNSGFTNSNVYSAHWVDFDNDGRLDVLVAGNGSPTLWRNTGNGFSNILSWPRISVTEAALGDYDNDGRTDVLIVDYDQPDDNTKILRNSTGGFYVPAGTPLPVRVNQSALAWADYNRDGHFDLQIGGQLLKNVGEGNDAVFTNAIVPWNNDPNLNLPISWGDFNNDGLPDLLLGGQVWQNTGTGFTLFTEVTNIVPVPRAAAWGDYDGDGRLDLVVTGENATNYNQLETQIWRNTGNGFTNINAGLLGLTHSAVAWGDYDNDGRLDLLISGATNTAPNFGSNIVTRLYHNNCPVSNTPPTAPTGLAFAARGKEVGFMWNAATDAQTPSAGLTYNLRVGTAPGTSDIMTANAASNGKRRLSGLGNVQYNLFFPLRNLPVNQPLYASVQAVDASFAGSPFSTEKSFSYSLQVAPPTGPVPGDTNGDGIVSQAELDAVLANYWSYNPQPEMQNVMGLGGANVAFSLTNYAANLFSAETSTNLTNWQYLGPVTVRYGFTDTNPPGPQRFYRLRWP